MDKWLYWDRQVLGWEKFVYYSWCSSWYCSISGKQKWVDHFMLG